MRFILLVAVAITVATGCQTSPRVSSHIEMLNSEKRVLEDELYNLEYELEDALEEVDQLRTENERLNRRLGVLPPEPRSSEPRRTEPSTKRSTSPDLDLAPPMIDEGTLSEPRVEIPDQNSRPPDLPRAKSAPMAPAVPMTFIAPESAESNEPGLLELLPPEVESKSRPSHRSSEPERIAVDPADPRITHIYLDPLMTGGRDFDRRPGDDGIVVVLQPRNQENQYVTLAGPIAVVLVDPTQNSDQARIARWDLDARSVERIIHGTNTETGIRLQLQWPKGVPPTNRLQLFVRYETVDGRKLEASREVFVALPGQMSQRWTPRSSGRPRVLAASERTTHPSPEHQSPAVASAESPSPAEVQSASHDENVDDTLDQASPSAARPPAPKWQPQR